MLFSTVPPAPDMIFPTLVMSAPGLSRNMSVVPSSTGGPWAAALPDQPKQISKTDVIPMEKSALFIDSASDSLAQIFF